MNEEYVYQQQGQFRVDEDFLKNPLMATIKLARFKFPAKMISAGDDILDLGCGAGISSYFYASHTSGHVTAIDATDNLHEISAPYRRDNLSFVKGDLTAPPEEITKRSYDAVICVDVIEHFPKEIGVQILETYAALLRKGGMMIIGTPNRRSAEYRSESSRRVHIHEYEPDELKEVMQSIFPRVLHFSMNDEVVHTGFANMSWFFYNIAFKA